jgi:hypothetical protein
VNFLFRSSANCGNTFPFWNNQDIYLYIETYNYRQPIAENSLWLHSSWKERKKERKEKHIHIYIYIYVICSVYIQLYSYTRLCILLVITPVPSKTLPFSLPSPSLSQEANPLPRGTIEAAFVPDSRCGSWHEGQVNLIDIIL